MALALLAIGHSIAGTGAVSVVDAEGGHGRPLAVPALADAGGDGLLDSLIHGGFGGGVGLGDQDGHAVLGLLPRPRLGLEQVAVGKTDVVNGNGHIIFFSPFLLRI